MQIRELQPYLLPYADTGRIPSQPDPDTGSPVTGAGQAAPARGAYTVEISPRAREMSAASMGNQAVEAHTAAGPGVAGVAGSRGAEAVGAVECQTCKNREYQDGSDDSSVSFQTPTHIDPGAAESLVRAHEQEHVSHEKLRAEEKGGEVVSQHVAIHYQSCPECGRTYVAGGTTTTVTRSPAGNGAGSGATGEDGGKGVNVFA